MTNFLAAQFHNARASRLKKMSLGLCVCKEGARREERCRVRR